MRDQNHFEVTLFDRRWRLMIIIGATLMILAAVAIILIIAAGRDATESGSNATLSGTLGAAQPTASLTPTPPGPPTPTLTPSPTATLEPTAYTVQDGDTLVAILCSVGYCYPEIVPTVVALNNMPSENQPLIPGTTLLIPRATPTPGPSPQPPEQTTETAAGPAEETPPGEPGEAGTADYSNCSLETPCVSPDGQYWIHTIQEGETIAGLAFAYGTRVDAILQANGLPQNPLIFPGNQLLVPILVTLTPTLTPTGGPDSTATPTPGYSAPQQLAPANGLTLERGQNVVLQWVADRPLAGGAYYLVVVRNTATGQEFRATTNSNALRLPAELQPGLGGSTRYEWLVLVVSGASVDSAVISGQGSPWVFTWGS